ncbi:MAG: aspartate-semialdehyde dehydrogenase [Candidatus Acidiferrales bacterium]
MSGKSKIEVGILGATGVVGQHFLQFLEGHPWFEVAWLGASDRSAGKKFSVATAWRLDGAMPEPAAQMILKDCTPRRAPQLMFSALDASVAGEIESAFARAGHIVVSNARNHRMDPDVPLLVPEINPGHLRLLDSQKRNRKWRGCVVTNPNCSTAVLTMALAPLKSFGVARAIVTTFQAISGAGYPGVSGMDINGNVIPFIGGEEEKIERETQKILGEISNGAAKPAAFKVSAHCNRVPVLDGHTITVSVELRAKPGEKDVLAAFHSFKGVPQQRKLPSAPAAPIIFMTEPDRPQPRRDASRERGMAVFVGRLRPCHVLDYKFVAVGNNTIRGAAGGAVLNAELMKSERLLGS